jgi:hypothetical protein
MDEILDAVEGGVLTMGFSKQEFETLESLCCDISLGLYGRGASKEGGEHNYQW